VIADQLNKTKQRPANLKLTLGQNEKKISFFWTGNITLRRTIHTNGSISTDNAFMGETKGQGWT
jgi:hypothetical protein